MARPTMEMELRGEVLSTPWYRGFSVPISETVSSPLRIGTTSAFGDGRRPDRIDAVLTFNAAAGAGADCTWSRYFKIADTLSVSVSINGDSRRLEEYVGAAFWGDGSVMILT